MNSFLCACEATPHLPLDLISLCHTTPGSPYTEESSPWPDTQLLAHDAQSKHAKPGCGCYRWFSPTQKPVMVPQKEGFAALGMHAVRVGNGSHIHLELCIWGNYPRNKHCRRKVHRRNKKIAQIKASSLMEKSTGRTPKGTATESTLKTW